MKKWEQLLIPLADIQQATNSFRNEIGRGGYGSVYDGELVFEQKLTKIAVKKLNKAHGQGLKEFLTEIDSLSSQQHQNIITLVGYCDEGEEKIIVYKHAKHGSLDRYIRYSNTTEYTRSWLNRLKIVVEAACGLDHLHNHLHNNHVIIHRDIKSSNILLDHNWVAKISDLGLARSTFSGFGKTTVISNVCGTIGYVEPEYLQGASVSPKSDVYSFGMVLFEVLCGRLCTDKDNEIQLIAHVIREHYDKNKLDELIHPSLREQISKKALRRYSTTAYKCLLGREDRPPMQVVKKELEEILMFEKSLSLLENQLIGIDLDDDILPLSPHLASPLSTFAIASAGLLVDSGKRFIFMVKDLVDQLTHLEILHFGGYVLTRILQLFDQCMDELTKALPEPSEDDSLMELKEAVPFRAETDSQQLALLGTAFTIAEELLPMVTSKIWSVINESKEAAGNRVNDNIASLMNNVIDYKDWRRQLQHSLDKLRDHFCRLYVLNFIYSLDGKTRPDAHIYLSGETDDRNWDSDPLPSLPFQALFWKLQQFATVASDVLHGKERIQKVLLTRLTETVVMWLMSNEEDFWGVLENQVSKLQLQGLQQLILDMHFTVEIARNAGYPSRNVHQITSSIIARAIRTFSGRGLNQQRVLPEDEWFVETAKAAINKLLMEGSEIDEDPDDDDNDDDDDVTSESSFATAESQMLDSLSDFTDPES